MFTSTFQRWSATAVLSGGLLLTIGYWLRPDIEKELIDSFSTTTALISIILVACGSLLLITGLPAILAQQCSTKGKGGFAAFALTLTGIAGFHLGTLSLYFVLPVLATYNSATRGLLYSDAPPFPMFAVFWAITLLIQVVGLMWIGIRSWKPGIFPKSGVLLFIAGSLTLLAVPISFHLLKPGTTLVMAGLVICSASLLRTSKMKQHNPSSPEINPVLFR
ncbi:MAG: hypothetical protein C5B59_12665 [Bacteroidetes bacterium]|nr:MAG: hypothetical protein C5B59_12665 [Bacteroidota bacterium]